MLFLWILFYSLVNYKQALGEEGNSTTPEEPSHHPVPTLLGVIITMVAGTLVVALTLIPMCIIKQEDSYNVDPKKPLLGNNPLD